MEFKFDLVKGIILVHGSAADINGVWAWDTGAEWTTVNSGRVSLDGTACYSAMRFSEQIEETGIEEAVLSDLVFGDLRLSQQKVLVMDMSYVENELKKDRIDLTFLGVIGQSHMKNMITCIDYNKRILTTDYQGPLHGTSVSFELNPLPVVMLSVEGELLPFVLDTGANTCLIDKNYESILAPKGRGCCQPKSKIEAFEFAGYCFKDVPVLVTDLSELNGRIKIAGIIGYDLLKDSFVVFDNVEHRLFLEK